MICYSELITFSYNIFKLRDKINKAEITLKI